MHCFDYLFPCSLSLYFQHVCCLTFLNSNELTCLCMSLLVNISKRSVHFIYFCYCSLVIKSCLTLYNTWTVACQAPLSMGFPRQEYWSGLPFPSPGDLPDPGIKPMSPALQAASSSLHHLGIQTSNSTSRFWMLQELQKQILLL